MTRKRAVRRYAEGTSVPVGKTRNDIEELLTKHGAGQILHGVDNATRSGFVGFTLERRQYRMDVPRRVDERSRNRDPEQVQREQWRALLLVIKAKLEFVSAGMTTAETEFMANIVLPNGSTVGAELAPRLEQVYATGEVRALLTG